MTAIGTTITVQAQAAHRAALLSDSRIMLRHVMDCHPEVMCRLNVSAQQELERLCDCGSDDRCQLVAKAMLAVSTHDLDQRENRRIVGAATEEVYARGHVVWYDPDDETVAALTAA